VDLEPKLILGDQFVDFRGIVKYNNNLSLNGFNRFYTLQNSEAHPFRGWHGHAKESKIFIAAHGSFRVGAVRVRKMLEPDPLSQPTWFDLSKDRLDGLFIPAGFANASISLEPGSVLFVLSNATLAQSEEDDFRFPPQTWGVG
jgi:dTDP-4-dehydrorhamnose 3,5-epimerase-like enzyme